MSNSSIWRIDMTPQGQSEPGNNDNEELLHIPESIKTELLYEIV